MKKAFWVVLTITLNVILLTEIGVCYIYVRTAVRQVVPGCSGWHGVRTMAIKDNYAYIIWKDHILVMDISDKYYSTYCCSEETIVHKVDVIGDGSVCLKIKDDFLYLTKLDKLFIIDISDPQSAYVWGTLEDDRIGNIVSIYQDYLYTSKFNETISKYDLRDKHNPVLVNSIELPIDDNSHIADMDIYNDRIFVTTDQGLFILDASSLTILKSYPVKSGLGRILIENGYAFIVCGINQDVLDEQPLFDWPLEKNFGFHFSMGGVLVLNISDDKNLTIVHYFDGLDYSTFGYSPIDDIVKSPEGLIYLKVYMAGIYCIDPHNHTEITFVGSRDNIAYLTHSEIAVAGDYIYPR